MSSRAEPSTGSGQASLTLRNVLRLEQRRKFDDRAVVGGLTALVDRLGPEAGLAAELIHELNHYAELSVEKRSALVGCALEALGDARGPALTPTLSQRERGKPLAPPLGEAGRRPAGPTTGEGGARTAPAPKPTTTGKTLTPSSSQRERGPLLPTAPLAALPGVGATRARRLATLGLHTAGDLRVHFPHRYVFYPPPRPASHLGFEQLASFEGTVIDVSETQLPGNRRRINALLRDDTGLVGASWIRAGRFSLGIRPGIRLAVSGPLIRYGRQITFENPEFEPADRPPLHTRRPVPVYPLTAGVSQLFMRALVRQTLDRLPPAEDQVPGWLLDEELLLDRQAAIEQIHAPPAPEAQKEASLRLAFDELLPIELLVLDRRRRYQAEPTQAMEPPWGLLAEFRRQLPFALTGGQQRVLSTLLDDLANTRPMVRLLQGDVGAGKTVVAAMALLAVMAGGGQGALLAPTEILAEQHFRTLSALYGDAQGAIARALGRPVRLRLLTGALSRKDREAALGEIGSNAADLVVGTHAVIQGDVEFANLVLAVVDEQHRFGVEQRVAIRRKGRNPHVLVMTATPIPRTLALTVYGDLDVSLIDEMPPGRQPVDTVLLQPEERARAYEQVRVEVAAGHQAFVICPLVEGSPAVEVRAAVTEYERLQEHDLGGLRLALLHGRMRPAAKDQVMRDFAQGRYDVLVTTPVVEVGVDVPNATVMLIEGAERFGLAQLHQFRGRIGRGNAPAQCFLIAGGESVESLARLEALASSHNGLELAEADLRLRGPGDYFGVRQSGFPALRVADITDVAFVQRVREAAARVLIRDPDLSQPEHGGLADAVRRLTAEVQEPN